MEIVVPFPEPELVLIAAIVLECINCASTLGRLLSDERRIELIKKWHSGVEYVVSML